MYPCMERRGVGEEGRRLPFFSDLLQSIYWVCMVCVICGFRIFFLNSLTTRKIRYI
jgi:hypothetical protein